MQVHADHFPEDERDEVWLAEAGARGWTVITRDRGIRYRETEPTALKAAGVAAFVLTAKGCTGPQNGAILAKALPAMLRYLVGNRPPFIAAVSASSRLSAGGDHEVDTRRHHADGGGVAPAFRFSPLVLGARRSDRRYMGEQTCW